MATSTLPSLYNSEDALRQYLAIRKELGELEGREAECTCDADEFHACEICDNYAQKNQRTKLLIELWGDSWAVKLGTLRAEKVEPQIATATGKSPASNAPESKANLYAAATNPQIPPAAAQITRRRALAEILNVETREALYAFAAEIKQLRGKQGVGVIQLASDDLRTPRSARRATVTGTAAEFSRLLERRDLAAYRTVAALQLVIDFLEAQDYDSMYVDLRKVLDEFEDIDRRITAFRSELEISQKGEFPRHGNRTA